MSYRKAIEKLRDELEATPGDLRLLQKLGELLQKANDPKAAAETSMREASVHLRDGFPLKAVALLKQVLKLDPSLLTAREMLASTLAALQLTTEAIDQFQQLRRDYAVLERLEDVTRITETLSTFGVA